MRAANLPSLRGLITSGYQLRIATAKAISEAEVYFRHGSVGETAQTAALKDFFDAAKDAVELAETISTYTVPVNTVAPTAPSGTAQVGETLTADDGTWTGTPTPTITYQWLRDGAPIEGETAATYDLVADDEGAVITVAVTATNAKGVVTVVSPGTAPVLHEDAPVNTVAPTAPSGTAQVSETLTADDGTWTGTPTPVITRQWLRDDVPIEGETDATYTLVSDDEGAVIKVAVTATNTHGAVTVISPGTAEVLPE